MRPLQRYIDICHINGAPVWNMESGFSDYIRLRDPITVLSAFGDETVQSARSTRADAGRYVIIPNNDSGFYDHRSDIRHFRLPTIWYLHLDGDSRDSFSVICSCTDVTASRPDSGEKRKQGIALA
ncbi:hypothetical protein PthBH41_17560 [Parageobacillus thermoglucosidasius]|nr:hypothetical protein PthBH41_17560 [Parageobacillus thermoglucosidasius]